MFVKASATRTHADSAKRERNENKEIRPGSIKEIVRTGSKEGRTGGKDESRRVNTTPNLDQQSSFFIVFSRRTQKFVKCISPRTV